MARAVKATTSIGRGAALPPAATSTFEAFIVDGSADAGEPDGLYHRRQGNWVRDAGTSGTVTEIGTGTALPPITSPFTLFVVTNSADPIGEPDGAYYRVGGSWART